MPLGELPSAAPSGDRVLGDLRDSEGEVHIPTGLLFDLLDEKIGNFGEATRAGLARFEDALKTGGAIEVQETLEAYIHCALADVYNEDRGPTHRGVQAGHRPTFMGFAVRAAYLIPLNTVVENQKAVSGGALQPTLKSWLEPLVQPSEFGEIPLGIMIGQAVRGERRDLEEFLSKFDELLAASDPRLIGFTMKPLVDETNVVSSTAKPAPSEPALVRAGAPKYPISRVLLSAFDRFDAIQEARRAWEEQRTREAWEKARFG